MSGRQCCKSMQDQACPGRKALQASGEQASCGSDCCSAGDPGNAQPGACKGRQGLRACRMAVWLVGLLAAFGAVPSRAQQSGIVPATEVRPGLRLYTHSWMAERPAEVKQVRLHDLVTVVVSEQAQVTSEGEMDRKKKAEGSMTLEDWILLRGLTAIPDPQSAGDPTISAKMDNKLRSEAELETRDAIKFRIACTVVDIRPNGNLVLEGHRIIRNNNETWEYALTGEVRAEDILPNNTVLSENVANLRIDKRESGHVRDGYRRGWLLRFLDTWQPF